MAQTMTIVRERHGRGVAGVPRSLYTGRDYVIIQKALVVALDGNWARAAVFQRIAWRCERSGTWVATMAQIAEETAVSVRSVGRHTDHLRELGWLVGARSSPWDPTNTWSIQWAESDPLTNTSDEDAHHETANLSVSQPDKVAASQPDTVAVTPSPKPKRQTTTETPLRAVACGAVAAPSSLDQEHGLVVETIFEAWCMSLGNSAKRTLTPARTKAIIDALKTYDAEDVLDAVVGWRKDAWRDRPQHNDLPIILRPANLEKFRDLERNKVGRSGDLHAPMSNTDPRWSDPNAMSI